MKQGQERTTQKRTDVSQIFDIFAPKNCDQKVTKFCSDENLLVRKDKKKVPPVGQTLGSSHFEETPLSLGGGDFAVANIMIFFLYIILMTMCIVNVVRSAIDASIRAIISPVF